MTSWPTLELAYALHLWLKDIDQSLILVLVSNGCPKNLAELFADLAYDREWIVNYWVMDYFGAKRGKAFELNGVQYANADEYDVALYAHIEKAYTQRKKELT